MATSVFCLALICLISLIPPSQSAAPAARSEEAAEELVLSGGPQSQLFSQCVKDAQTVKGILYSMTVSEDEKFVRYVPKEKIDFDWTTVDIGDTPSIIHCAQEAYRLSVYMFKFDGSCSVAFNSAYDPKSEQGCDGAAAEVVYITSRPFNAFEGRVVPFGEFFGCYYSSPEGMRYEEKYGHLVHESNLPTPATCCPTTDEGYCLFMKHSSSDRVSHCEANAYCDALGVPLVGKDFFEDFVGKELEHPVDPSVLKRIWINLRRINGTWLWVPEMEEFSHTPINQDTDPIHNFATLKFTSNTFNYNSTDSGTLYHKNDGVYCYERTTTLPQCP